MLMLAKHWSCIKVQAGLTVILQPISPNANNWHALGSLTAPERMIFKKVLNGCVGTYPYQKSILQILVFQTKLYEHEIYTKRPFKGYHNKSKILFAITKRGSTMAA